MEYIYNSGHLRTSAECWNSVSKTTAVLGLFTADKLEQICEVFKSKQYKELWFWQWLGPFQVNWYLNTASSALTTLECIVASI
jgi:hypothetical protein